MFSHDVRSCFSGAWYSMKPMYPDRMILLILFNIINWLMAAFGVSSATTMNYYQSSIFHRLLSWHKMGEILPAFFWEFSS